MKLEILFPEICNLYGDRGNIKFLENCFDKKDFVYTSLLDEPYFMKNDVKFIYLGPMSESIQEKVIKKMLPYKKRIKQLIDQGVVFLFVGNALEILGKVIYKDDGEEIKGLGIFDIKTKRHQANRYNSLVLTNYDDIEVVGYISQSSSSEINETSLFNVQKSKDNMKNEGVHINNFFGTSLLGPILILNPYFAKEILLLLGYKKKIKHEQDLIEAYKKRLEEYKKEGIKY